MILLFDVDGVLVEHRAYREGIRRTVAYFCNRLGLATVEPSDGDIEVFESHSITVEWETCAILVARLLLKRLRADMGSARRREAVLSLPPNFWTALGQLARPRRPLAADVDVAGVARWVGSAQQPAAQQPGGRANGARYELPSHTALRLLREAVEDGGAVPPEKALPLLEDVLGNVYEIDRSPAAQVFQNVILGRSQYAHYYERPPLLDGECLLDQLDRPLLQPETAATLLDRRAVGAAFPVLYTARPSLAPVEAGAFHRGLTPESEIARSQVRLDGVPVMGQGKVTWYARRLGLRGDSLVKPSPVQALAAIAAARTGLEIEALKAALAVARGDHLRYPLTACAGQTVHVFEDSASSLRGVAHAVELVNRQGLGLRLVCHGIASARSTKHEALAAAADDVFPDVNAAVTSVLGATTRQ